MRSVLAGVVVFAMGACTSSSDESATGVLTTATVGLTSTGAGTSSMSSGASQGATSTAETDSETTAGTGESTTETPEITETSSTGDTTTETEGETETETAGETETETDTDATTTDDPPQEFCLPLGNLLDVGTLDAVAGDAPAGWEVRTPGMVEACAGSGPHLFASPPAPGCDGAAVTIDANDAWDCYAVQTVSPYNSIEGGATYRIRATVRSQGNTVNPAAWFILGVQWLDANDSFFGDEKNPQPESAADNDFEWKVLEWEVVAPDDARRILVWLTAHYPGEVSYDHVAVIKVD